MTCFTNCATKHNFNSLKVNDASELNQAFAWMTSLQTGSKHKERAILSVIL